MLTNEKDQFYFAPMEGITGYLFRNEFHRQFDTNHEITKYFGPFVAATREGLTKSRDQKDVDPQNNQEITLVPQLLGNSGEYAIPYLEKFEELGYGEVNLNIGCPYGTVVSKKKGAGLLAQTELLENYLETIFAWKDRTRSTLSISVKTRSGMNRHEEWEELLEIYNEYPLSELILHPRIGTDLYANHPQTQVFAYAISHSKHTLCYNGDLFTKEDFREMKQLFPENTRWMLGRGLLVNPSLLREIQGGPAISREEFLTYQDNITINYVNQKWGDKTVLFKMKELWNYWQYLFKSQDRESGNSVEQNTREPEYYLSMRVQFGSWSTPVRLQQKMALEEEDTGSNEKYIDKIRTCFKEGDCIYGSITSCSDFFPVCTGFQRISGLS